MSCPHSNFRPCWDCYFLGLADAVAVRGDCIRKTVGAVLVGPDFRVLSTGYNGSEPGGPSCLAGECPRCLSDAPSGSSYEGCIEHHAERNAIMWARPDDRPGSTLYITWEPCGGCSELIRTEGVSRLVWYTPTRLVKGKIL
ncbi:deoxycytidylate deaminase [Streptomyces sp. NPDC047990]|uniref:deoxycytidylate deaminase n=1 Tax=Streptomyces sp. NPDC047990 TaxID=3365496 RepID=UPI003719F9AF